MPSPQHEALHKVFTHDKELFTRALRKVFRVDLETPVDVSIINTDYTAEPGIPAPHGDSALLAELLIEEKEKRYVIIVESQSNPDWEISYRWPYYITYLHNKYKCPVVLLVVTSSDETARWARKPISIGLPGMVSNVTYAIVLGPDNVPEITDPAEAVGDVVFAVLSAMTNSLSPQIGVILDVLHTALSVIDEESASKLSEFTEAGLGDTPAREIWRKFMATSTYPYVSQVRSEGRSEGRAEGRAQTILEVLEDRGVTMEEADRARILACTDTGTLKTWVHRVTRVSKISELFED